MYVVLFVCHWSPPTVLHGSQENIVCKFFGPVRVSVKVWIWPTSSFPLMWFHPSHLSLANEWIRTIFGILSISHTQTIWINFAIWVFGGRLSQGRACSAYVTQHEGKLHLLLRFYIIIIITLMMMMMVFIIITIIFIIFIIMTNLPLSSDICKFERVINITSKKEILSWEN